MAENEAQDDTKTDFDGKQGPPFFQHVRSRLDVDACTHADVKDSKNWQCTSEQRTGKGPKEFWCGWEKRVNDRTKQKGYDHHATRNTVKRTLNRNLPHCLLL